MASADFIARLTALRDAYEAAELAVLRNQSYEMPDGRKLVRANLADIRKGRKEAQAALDLETGCGRPVGRMRRAVNMNR
jgi:hypothetical protein